MQGFRDALVFRAGRQIKLFTWFEHDGLRFAADWHRRGERVFLSVEVLPHHAKPYQVSARRLAGGKLNGVGARLIPYDGFCIEHRHVEAVAEEEDHVFYLGPDVRGVEAVAWGRTRAECKERMELLLSRRGARKLVEQAFAGAVGKQTPLAEVRRSGIAGRGLFARRPIASGTVVGALDRPLVRFDEAPGAGHPDYGHAIQMERGWWQLVRPSPFYYWNHSCAPNTRLERLGVVAQVVALHPIKAGEELTGDYSDLLFRDDPFSFVCGCGVRTCRGVVRGGLSIKSRSPGPAA